MNLQTRPFNLWPYATLVHELFKTGQITPGTFETADGYSNHEFATVLFVLSFSFLFISAESLKNHSKSQKIHKIENLILLDST
jgi:hypothetical protein